MTDESIREQACWLADRARLQHSIERGKWVDACVEIIEAERARCAKICRDIADDNKEGSYLIGATALRCASQIENATLSEK